MSSLLPAKPVWRGLGLRRTTTTGLARLRKEVRECEYSDVHVMWEMLSNPSGSGVRDGRRATAGKGAVAAATRRDRAWAGTKAVAVAWSRLASYCCAM